MIQLIFALSLSLANITLILSAISSIAVIAGAIFVVFQLRQNGRLIRLQLHENRSNIAFALLEKVTDESFAQRRKKMHDVIRKYSERNWEGFDDSLEDFEARNFAYTYELMGQFVKDGIVDGQTMMNALQYLVVVDWNAFAPLSDHLMQRFKISVTPWQNFRWLAEETRKQMERRERVKPLQGSVAHD
jgi:hypothetical protein